MPDFASDTVFVSVFVSVSNSHIDSASASALQHRPSLLMTHLLGFTHHHLEVFGYELRLQPRPHHHLYHG